MGDDADTRSSRYTFTFPALPFSFPLAPAPLRFFAVALCEVKVADTLRVCSVEIIGRLGRWIEWLNFRLGQFATLLRNVSRIL